MATEFGPATVKVSLDVAAAKRQIEDLRREIMLSTPAAVPDRTPVQNQVLKKTNPRIGHPGVSGSTSDDPHQGNDPYWTHDNISDGLRLLKWLKTTDRMRKFAPIHVQKSLEDASLVNQGAEFVKDKLGLGAEVAGTTAGVAATTATLYAAVSATAKVAPYAVQALSGVVGVPPEVQGFLNDFKAVINNLENRVSNIVKAPKEALDIWSNGARITGQLPDFLYYWNQAYDIGVAEDDLRDKFDHFKRMEVAGAIGKGVGEAFQKSFDR